MLSIVVVVLVLCDMLLTYVAVAVMGFREGNPIIAYLLSRYGFHAALFFSLFVVSSAILIIVVLFRYAATAVLVMLILAYLFILMVNAVGLMLRIHGIY